MYAQVAQNEKGAALVGSVKEKFGGVFKFLFFTCATIVTFSGVLSIVVAATNFRPAFDFVNYVPLSKNEDFFIHQSFTHGFFLHQMLAF